MADVDPNAPKWYVSNKYNAAAACRECTEIITHAKWCPAVNPEIYYAHTISVYTDLISEADVIFLHGLGVKWTS